MGPPSQPLFVVLEGPDGAGTTTVAGLLSSRLRERGLRVCLTAEPTQGPFGRFVQAHLVRELELEPHAAALLFLADRADHTARTIRPALARGEWVVCDRYLLSTLAYQGAEGVDRKALAAASRDLPVPDLVAVLDAPAEVRRARLDRRERRDRYEDPALEAALAASYEASIELLRSLGQRVERFDATRAPHEVAEAVLVRLDTVSAHRLYTGSLAPSSGPAQTARGEGGSS